MTEYRFITRPTFDNDLKELLRLDRNIGIELKLALEILRSGEELPDEYRDHSLVRSYSGYREFHLRDTPKNVRPSKVNDIVVIYKKHKHKYILVGVRIGSHDKVFSGKYHRN